MRPAGNSNLLHRPGRGRSWCFRRDARKHVARGRCRRGRRGKTRVSPWQGCRPPTRVLRIDCARCFKQCRPRPSDGQRGKGCPAATESHAQRRGWAATGQLTFLHRRFQPRRAKEHSPAFQGWGNGHRRPQVPSGTTEPWLRRRGDLSSLTGLAPLARPQTGVETLGYSLYTICASQVHHSKAEYGSIARRKWYEMRPPLPTHSGLRGLVRAARQRGARLT
jgi:hypothetical protein